MNTRTTEAFRVHHAEIREHLNHIDAMAAALPGQPPSEQRKTMQKVVSFLKEHIGPHAADEERVLYPVVEQQADNGSRLTSVPIYEHRIVERRSRRWNGRPRSRLPMPLPFPATPCT